MSELASSRNSILRSDTVAERQAAVPRWFVPAALVLAVVLLVPFLATPIPPLLDFPNHVAEMYVIAHDAADPILAKFFSVHWTVVANSGVELVMPILLRWFPLWQTGRVFVMLALLLPLAGTIAYSRAVFGRWSAWSLAGGLVAYNTLFLLGFMNFVIGLGFALLFAAFWIAYRVRFPAWTIAGGIVGALMLFFVHMYGLIYFALLIGAHELVSLWGPPGRRWPTPGAVLRRLLPDALIFVAPAILLLTSTLAATSGPVIRLPLKIKLGELFYPFLNYYQTPDRLVMVGVLAIMAALLFWRRAEVASQAVIAVVALMVAWPFVPHVAMQTAFLDSRLPTMAGFLLFAGFAPRRLPRGLGVGLFALIALVMLVRVGFVTHVWAGHSEDIAELREVIAHVPPGSTVLVVDTPNAQITPYWLTHRRNWMTAAYVKTYYHNAGFLIAERDAFWPRMFTGLGKQPVVVNPQYDTMMALEGELPDYHELAKDKPSAKALDDAPYLADWQHRFDYVLVMAAGADPDLAALNPARLQLIASTEFAALFRVRPGAL